MRALVLFLLLTLCPSLRAHDVAVPTTAPPPPAVTGPVVVKAGLYLLNVGRFDIATGTYTADFYLTLRSDRDMGNPRFEFMNGRAATMDVLDDTPTYKQYRVQANLMANLDLRRFPWDEHHLPIILESATRQKSDLTFVADTERVVVDPAVIFVGWQLQGFDAVVDDHVYPGFNETYSQATFRVHIARLKFISSLKTFLPVLCFLFIAFTSLLVTLERLDSRVGINTAMLIAAVMFHVSITSSLPASASLTIADKAVIATYITIGISLLLSVLMMRLVQQGRSDDALALRERAFKIVPACAIVGYVVVAISSL